MGIYVGVTGAGELVDAVAGAPEICSTEQSRPEVDTAVAGALAEATDLPRDDVAALTGVDDADRRP